jgi:hypothetical protein
MEVFMKTNAKNPIIVLSRWTCFLGAMLTVSFMVSTAIAAGPAPVILGTAGSFAILAKTGISTTGTTAIVGDIGVSPAAATYITGFGLIKDASGTFSTSSLVTGNVYAADYTAPTPTKLTTAIGDMGTAYTNAAGRTLPDATELGAGNITTLTLTRGLYKWGSGVTIGAGGVTISGSATDVWIFQIAQDLTLASGAIVTLSGGAVASNVFWQVAGQVTLGTTAQMKGNILCQTQIAMNTGATLDGRALAQTAVTLIANPVTIPPPLRVNAKAFLQGPFSGGAMTTTLNSGGLLPLIQPYSATPFSYSGTENVATGFFASNPTVVDWVLIQLRSTSGGAAVATAAALLKSDGTVVDVDGTSAVPISSITTAGSYFIVVKHRNHLSIMSAAAVALSTSSALYNFTTAQAQAFGTNPMIALTGGVFGLYAGDSNVDGQVTALDFNTWNANTKAGQVGYVADDMNLDGQVTALDFNVWNANTKLGAATKVP